MKAILEKRVSILPKEKPIVKLGDWLRLKVNEDNIICMVMMHSFGYNLVNLNGELILSCSFDNSSSINAALDQRFKEWEFIELKYTFKDI